MPTLQGLRRQIESGEQLHSIVRTMKTIAAVNIRHFERAVESLQDYSETIERGLQIVLRERPGEARLLHAGPSRKPGAVVFGSDQGMCGQFNERVSAHMLDYIRRRKRKGEDWIILPIGERVFASVSRSEFTVEGRLSMAGSLDGITPVVRNILMHIDRWRVERHVDAVHVFHNQAVSGSSYQPYYQRMLPMDRAWLDQLNEREWPTRALPMFTMEWDPLLSSLVGQYLFTTLYRACAESVAAENASRIASMQSAERNIEELLNGLNAAFRHKRQQSITEELLDIISGFEALTE